MITQPTPYEALQQAVLNAGSQSAFARSLNVTQAAVWKWLRKSKELPAEYVLTAERLYGVSRHLLRPDIYPIDLPPFVPAPGDVTKPGSKDPCERQPDLQRGEEAEPRLALAHVTARQEQYP